MIFLDKEEQERYFSYFFDFYIHLKDKKIKKMIFYDHVLSKRIKNLINLLPNFSRKNQMNALLVLTEDFNVLSSIVNEKINNHNYMSYEALLSFVLSFPNLPHADFLKKELEKRLERIILGLFSEDGENIEQSAIYQFYDLLLVKAGVDYFKENLKIQDRINLAKKIEPLLVMPNDLVVPVGTIDSNRKFPVGKIEKKVNILDGFSLFYDALTNRYLFIDYSKQRYVHGHYDALNFIFSDDNGPIITDGAVLKDDFTESFSSIVHNVPFIFGKKQHHGDTKLLDFTSQEDCYILSLETNVYSPIKIKRTFFVINDLSEFGFVDQIIYPADIANRKIQHPIILDPSVNVKCDKNNCTLEHKGKQYFVQFLNTNHSVLEEKIDVSYSYGKRQKTKSLKYLFDLPANGKYAFVFFSKNSDSKLIDLLKKNLQ